MMMKTATMSEGMSPNSGNSLRPPPMPEASAGGYAPTGPVRKGGFAWAVSLKRKLTGEAVTSKQLLIVTSQLSVMLAAGCDLCAGLEALSRQQGHPNLKRILTDLHTRVKQGQSFSASLAQHPE